jgi:hypothetical protein
MAPSLLLYGRIKSTATFKTKKSNARELSIFQILLVPHLKVYAKVEAKEILLKRLHPKLLKICTL